MSSPLEIGKGDDCSGGDDDEREQSCPGRFGETNSDVTTAHPVKTLTDNDQASVPKKEKKKAKNPKRNQQKESPGYTQSSTPSLPKDDEQPSVPNNEQGLNPNRRRLNKNKRKAKIPAETEQEELSGNKEFSLLAAANQGLKPNRGLNRRKATSSSKTKGQALTGNQKLPHRAAVALQMAEFSDSNDSVSDDSNDYDSDDDGDEEQRPGAIPVPGLFGKTSSFDSVSWTTENNSVSEEPMDISVENSTAIDSLPIIAELTDDVEQRVQRQVEERVEMELEERLRRNQEHLQNQIIITEAVEVKSGEIKTWFGFPRFWILSTVAIFCSIAIILGVTLSSTKNSRSGTSSFSNTTSPSNTTRFREFVEWLGPNVANNIRGFDDPSTTQYATMHWLANIDKFVPDEDSNVHATKRERIYLERYVVALMFFSLQGSSWYLTLNFLSETSVCDWNIRVGSLSDAIYYSYSNVYGITCNDDLEVTAMNLEEVGLKGSIGVYENQLTGSIPSQIGFLTQMAYLDVGTNQLTGIVPSEIGLLTQMTYFSAPSNALTGSIPLPKLDS